jgi:hypothetical protein
VSRTQLGRDLVAVAADGGYAFLAQAGYSAPAGAQPQAGMRVVDLTRPAEPRPLSFLPLVPAVTGLALGDGLVYLHQQGATSPGRLLVVDARAPDRPRLLGVAGGSTNDPVSAVSGSLLLTHYLRVLDVSAPQWPQDLGRLPGSPYAVDIAAADGAWVLALGAGGLDVHAIQPGPPGY